MEFDVRPALAEDINYVLDIDVKSYDYPWPPEKWYTPSFSIAVATLRRTPIAVAAFEIKDGFVVLEKLAVRPNFRRRGVSRQLLNEVNTAGMYVGAAYIETTIAEHLCDPMKPECLLPWLAAVGFKGVGVKSQAFHNCGHYEDGYIFRRGIQ